MGAVIPARLLEAREGAGFTPEDVAGALRCQPQLVTSMEQGTTAPKAKELAHLARLYHRPVSWFTGAAEPPLENPTAGEGYGLLFSEGEQAR
jgi:transcriptional regulator with XRE-family HTH domain